MMILKRATLARLLTQKWGWGKLSAPEVQEIAHAAFQDGLRLAQVHNLASIGQWGIRPGNMQRDLLYHIGKLPLSQSTYMVDLKLNVKGTTWTDTTCTLLLPHKLFASLFHFKPEAFKEFILGGDPSNIKTFWTKFKNHPLLTSRPSLQTRNDLLTGVVPLGLHGDGVQYMQVHRTGGKGLDVLSWSSMLSKGPTKFSNWLMVAIVKTVVKTSGIGKTWPKVWKVLEWSFDALAKGRWPETNWQGDAFDDQTSVDYQNKGKLLANGFSAVLLVLKSDFEFLASHFDLNHTSSNEPCCLCRADRQMESRPWTDVRMGAAWRTSTWSKEEWAASHPHCHPFFKMGDNGIDMVFPDLMHVKHLGTDHVLLGSVLSWVVHNFLQGSVKENLEYVWDWIKQWQKELHVMWGWKQHCLRGLKVMQGCQKKEWMKQSLLTFIGPEPQIK